MKVEVTAEIRMSLGHSGSSGWTWDSDHGGIFAARYFNTQEEAALHMREVMEEKCDEVIWWNHKDCVGLIKDEFEIGGAL